MMMWQVLILGLLGGAALTSVWGMARSMLTGWAAMEPPAAARVCGVCQDRRRQHVPEHLVDGWDGIERRGGWTDTCETCAARGRIVIARGGVSATAPCLTLTGEGGVYLADGFALHVRDYYELPEVIELYVRSVPGSRPNVRAVIDERSEL